MLSCIIGLARMYQLTGKPEYLAVAVNAWEDISRKPLVSGRFERRGRMLQGRSLPAGRARADGPAEGCVTAHWIYLESRFIRVTGEIRGTSTLWRSSLYNYLLASQRPHDCHQSYNTPMNGTKNFQRHDVKGAVGKAPCCLTSVMRELARTPEAIWTKFASGGLGVLIYNAGTMEDAIQTDDGLLERVRGNRIHLSALRRYHDSCPTGAAGNLPCGSASAGVVRAFHRSVGAINSRASRANSWTSNASGKAPKQSASRWT